LMVGLALLALRAMEMRMLVRMRKRSLRECMLFRTVVIGLVDGKSVEGAGGVVDDRC
jgi:hypothetical protein